MELEFDTNPQQILDEITVARNEVDLFEIRTKINRLKKTDPQHASIIVLERAHRNRSVAIAKFDTQ